MKLNSAAIAVGTCGLLILGASNQASADLVYDSSVIFPTYQPGDLATRPGSDLCQGDREQQHRIGRGRCRGRRRNRLRHASLDRPGLRQQRHHQRQRHG